MTRRYLQQKFDPAGQQYVQWQSDATPDPSGAFYIGPPAFGSLVGELIIVTSIPLTELSFPTKADQAMSPLATSAANKQPTGLTLSGTPVGNVRVNVNGQDWDVGDGVTTSESFFSRDAGVTAVAVDNLLIGDALYWNGLVTGLDLAISDNVDFVYDIPGAGAGPPVLVDNVKVSVNDAIPGFLLDKIIAGAGITLVENNDGGNETLEIIAAASLGEANTASNVGTTGVGLFEGKVGSDLQYRKLSVGSNKITVTLDGGNQKVDIDLDEANVVHQNLSGAGSFTHTQLDDHLNATNNPHTVTKAQVGLSNVPNLKINQTATSDPLVTDDSTAGYAIDSKWVNTVSKEEFVLVDATPTAAVWKGTTQDTGDVVGPGAATDNALARYNGATGVLLQDSPNGPFALDDGTLILKAVRVSRKTIAGPQLPYNVGATDYAIWVDSTGGAVDIQLPVATVAGDGRELIIYDVGQAALTNAIRLLPGGTDTVIGLSVLVFPNNGASARIICDGAADWALV